MKTTLNFLTCTVLAAVAMMPLNATLNIPSDGSDGALVITTDTVIDLGQAITGAWDANNTANAGKGIYDPAKWAVVFKYSSVTIQSGATVTFLNHPSRAPVVWLVQGDVTINGTVSLDGQDYTTPPALAEPGPGGFRGGSGNFTPGASEAAGFGPGGGRIRVWNGVWGGREWARGAAGSYGSLGWSGLGQYGNPSLLPLIGGSGGGGAMMTYNYGFGGGGAGGGAMLIACAATMSVPGAISASGGSGYFENGLDYDFPAGSGGGIRLVADTLAGTGIVRALGGAGSNYGGLGRVRIERVASTSSLQTTPDPSVVALAAGATPQIWLPENGPMVRVVSIGGHPAPTDPRAEFGVIGSDTVLPSVSSTTVVIETTNVEQASAVTVRATPRSNGNYTETAASVSQVVSENPLVLRWTATVPVNPGYSAFQVRVVRP